MTMKHASIFILCLLALPALADIQIKTRSPMGGDSTITSNGKVARMDGGGQPGYMLLDLQSGAMRMVDDQRRSVMEMGMPASGSGTAVGSAVDVDIADRGAGPSIAGYATRRFDIKANGRLCVSAFGSTKLMKVDGVEALFNALTRIQQQAENMMGAFRGQRDPCEIADLKMAEAYKRIGAPMRVIDASGQLDSEVVSVDRNVSKPAEFYATPANYQVTNMQQQMNQARDQQQQMMRQMQQSMPDMQRMMQQMQQQGGMPPEAMEQMRKMQEMMQQRMPPQ
jgi:hypothetical protein